MQDYMTSLITSTLHLCAKLLQSLRASELYSGIFQITLKTIIYPELKNMMFALARPAKKRTLETINHN